MLDVSFSPVMWRNATTWGVLVRHHHHPGLADDAQRGPAKFAADRASCSQPVSSRVYMAVVHSAHSTLLIPYVLEDCGSRAAGRQGHQQAYTSSCK